MILARNLQDISSVEVDQFEAQLNMKDQFQQSFQTEDQMTQETFANRKCGCIELIYQLTTQVSLCQEEYEKISIENSRMVCFNATSTRIFNQICLKLFNLQRKFKDLETQIRMCIPNNQHLFNFAQLRQKVFETKNSKETTENKIKLNKNSSLTQLQLGVQTKFLINKIKESKTFRSCSVDFQAQLFDLVNLERVLNEQMKDLSYQYMDFCQYLDTKNLSIKKQELRKQYEQSERICLANLRQLERAIQQQFIRQLLSL